MSHLTITEISMKTGISKQRLYRFLNQNSINPSIKKSNKSFYSEVVQSLIYQHFNSDIQENIVESSDTSDTKPNTNYTKESLYTNDKEGFRSIQNPIQTMLEKEIDIKNKEIDNLQNLLKENQKLLDQQQQLTLQSNKQIESLQKQLLLSTLNKEKEATDTKETPEDQTEPREEFIQEQSEDTSKKWWQIWK